MRVTLAGLSSEHLTGCPMHSHGQWEIVVFLKGKGIHTVGEQNIPFCAGKIVCQPPGVAHGTRSDGEYQDMFIRFERYSPPGNDPVPIFEDDEDHRFQTLLRMIYEIFHRRESNWRALVDSLSDALCQLLVGWVDRKDEPPMVEAAVREMVMNIANPDFDLAELVKNSGYCPDYFRRCFRAGTGETPAQYMIRLRMDHAKQLLNGVGGEMSIRQAALLSGYQDPYYFSRLFRKHTGMSPSEYAFNNK